MTSNNKTIEYFNSDGILWRINDAGVHEFKGGRSFDKRSHPELTASPSPKTAVMTEQEWYSPFPLRDNSNFAVKHRIGFFSSLRLLY